MQYAKYNDDSAIALGGGKFYIAKSEDITTKIGNVKDMTTTELNTFLDTLIAEMKNVATVEGGIELTPQFEYIDSKVDGEIFKKFATTPDVTIASSVAEINVQNMAEFLMGGQFNKSTDGIEELSFDGETTPRDCYICYVMEDKATDTKYVVLAPRCSSTSAFTFNTNAKVQVTSNMNFGVYKPTKAIADSTGIADYYKLIKVPAVTSDDDITE